MPLGCISNNGMVQAATKGHEPNIVDPRIPQLFTKSNFDPQLQNRLKLTTQLSIPLNFHLEPAFGGFEVTWQRFLVLVRRLP